MNATVSVFANCLEAIIYLLLFNLHNCTIKAILYRWDHCQKRAFDTKTNPTTSLLPPCGAAINFLLKKATKISRNVFFLL